MLILLCVYPLLPRGAQIAVIFLFQTAMKLWYHAKQNSFVFNRTFLL